MKHTPELMRKRFDAKVFMCPMSGCWLWTAADNGFGYGTFRYNKRTVQAHRAAWMLFRGPIPNDRLVLHRCDVPACVNPAHLFLGTQKDNVADMIAKGRDGYDQRIYNTAAINSPDVRAKGVAALRAPEVRARISEKARDRWTDPMRRERQKVIAKQQGLDPVIKAKRRASLLRMWVRRRGKQS